MQTGSLEVRTLESKIFPALESSFCHFILFGKVTPYLML